MPSRKQFIGHNTTPLADAYLGLVREITVNLSNKTLRVHDGASPGGTELARADAVNLVASSTSQDGKITAAQVQALEAGTAAIAQLQTDLTSHVGAGGSVHAAATTGANGFMSSADKTKLDGIEAGASGDLSAGEILALLLTVDGDGSGIDADLLDGVNLADIVNDYSGNLYAPTTTSMLFRQTNAPLGWTKLTADDNKALRIVSGVPGTGGTQPFTTVFSRTATDSHTLTAAQSGLPLHNHGPTLIVKFVGAGGIFVSPAAGPHYTHVSIDNAGGTNASAGHTHNMDIRVQYVDVINATKD